MKTRDQRRDAGGARDAQGRVRIAALRRGHGLYQRQPRLAQPRREAALVEPGDAREHEPPVGADQIARRGGILRREDEARQTDEPTPLRRARQP